MYSNELVCQILDFLDENIKGIVSAIGGNDAYRLIPYLMEDKDFYRIKVVLVEHKRTA